MIAMISAIEESGVRLPLEGVAIRPVRTADLGAVAGIFAHYVDHTRFTFEETPPSEADWHHRLEQGAAAGLPFLVAEVDGRVAGYARCTPWREKPAYRFTAEDSIYLAPGMGGRGLGGELLAALLDDAAEAGVRQMVAVVVDDGEGASLALHRRYGFALVGRLSRVGHKHGRWLDTLLLQRGLLPASATPATTPHRAHARTTDTG
jgi:phosphinothricin acetyltransferase